MTILSVHPPGAFLYISQLEGYNIKLEGKNIKIAHNVRKMEDLGFCTF